MTFSPRHLLLPILAAYLLLALAYGVANPLFEAPDEHSHFFTAQYVAETGRLPHVAAEPDEWLGQEAAQPPLYYLLAAVILSPIDTAAARTEVWRNPFVRLGDAASPTNSNAFVHGPREAWPWQGYVLAAHLLRAFSALLGAGTLLLLYVSARLVWPARPERWLLAAAMIAFLPQFAFVHATVSNDALIILLATAALYQLLRIWLTGCTRPRLFLLGLTAGLAVLTKATGLLLLLFAAGVMLLLALRDKRPRLLLDSAVWLLLPALILSGWLLWRNWLLYGDPTAANQFVSYFSGSRDYSLGHVLAESSGLWLSLFAVFGWFNVRAPDWVYWLWNGIVLLAVIGAGAQLSTFSRQPSAAMSRLSFVGGHTAVTGAGRRLVLGIDAVPILLAAWFLLVYAALVRFMLLTPAAQGRLLFPAILPLALGLAYGLSYWRRLALVAPALALVTTLVGLLFVIPGAYRAPPVVVSTPATAVPFHFYFDDDIELVAADLITRSAQPGDWVGITLYWRRHTAAPAAAAAPQLVLELLGRDHAVVGKLQTFHGGGLYPANLWSAGDIVADRLAVRLEDEMVAPAEVRLNLKLVGRDLSLDVAALKVTPPQWPPASPAVAHFGDAIELLAANLSATTAAAGDTVTLAVDWHVTVAPGRDLTTFVHLGEAGQPPLAQADAPPLNGFYPSRYWAAGEVIADGYTLLLPADLPAGRYPIWIGLYDSQSLIRVPLRVDGWRPPHDAYQVEWLTVVPGSP
jgi:4-amino-4-deoxy-L-arabinose transferase-like glycosyltransferase